MARLSHEPSRGSAFANSDRIQNATPPSYSPSCNGTADSDITSEFDAAAESESAARIRARSASAPSNWPKTQNRRLVFVDPTAEPRCSAALYVAGARMPMRSSVTINMRWFLNTRSAAAACGSVVS